MKVLGVRVSILGLGPKFMGWGERLAVGAAGRQRAYLEQDAISRSSRESHTGKAEGARARHITQN